MRIVALSDSSPLSDSVLAPAKQIAQFIVTRDYGHLIGAFAPHDVVMLDSFYPYYFHGTDASVRWAEGFILHAKNLRDLNYEFGTPQEYSMRDELIFFSLPVSWTGLSNNQPFIETGAMALVLAKFDSRWLIRNYAWAVTSFSQSTPSATHSTAPR